VDANSSNIINFIGPQVTLHPDFGSGLYRNQPIGIPYQVVDGSQPKFPLLLGSYASQSDPVPIPIPPKALVEGQPNPGGDRHMLVLDKTGCWLYELFHAEQGDDGQWRAAASAVWDMTATAQRPATWTSTDAAGLPVFSGLVRYDEVAAGEIKHALRFTVPKTRRAFVAPASHWASRLTDPDAPPMGTRLRLKADFDISRFPPEVKVILIALKKYGMILADNGSGIFITGAPHPGWNNDNLRRLRIVTANNFEVVKMGTVFTATNVPKGTAPRIDSFSVSKIAAADGHAVRLEWKVRDSIYNFISPEVGPVRGNTVMVTPSTNTTYTIYATNQYGRTTKSLQVSAR
jgi:hypothetical protein